MAKGAAPPIDRNVTAGSSCAALLDHLNVSVVVIDADVRLLYANQSGSAFLGVGAAGHVGADVLQLVHPDDLEQARAALSRAAVHPGVAPAVTLRLLRGRGDYRWVEISADNQCDSPDIDGIVLTLRDVTSQVAAEDLFRSAFESAP